MRFELKAITQDGRIEALDFQALDESRARQQADGRGYTVLTLLRKSNLFEAWQARERFVATFVSQRLLVLLRSDLQILEQLDTVSENERHAVARAGVEHTA